jgi:hypothetical protein
MWEMMLDSAPEGTVMISREAITPGEVEDHLKDMLDRLTGLMVDLVIVYPVPGHPPMRSDVGFIELVSCIIISFPTDPILDLTIVVRSPIFMFESPIRHYRRMLRGERRTVP